MKLGYKLFNRILIICYVILYIIPAFGVCFNYDEAYTVGMIENSFSEILAITSRDVHSPVYYWILKLFCLLPFGNKLILSKLFSVIFMISFLILGKNICIKYYTEKIAFYWLICSGWMPAIIVQSSNTRMYSMALFVMTFALYLAFELFYNANRNKWLCFTIITVLCVYLHTFCMLEMVFVYLLLIICALIHKKYQLLKEIFLSGSIVSLCYLPWLLVLYHQFSRWAGWESGWSNTIEDFGIHSIYDYLAEWFSNLESPSISAIIFGIFLCSFTFIYAFRYSIKNKDYFPILGIVIMMTTVIISITVSVLIVPCFLGRYIFPLFGCLSLMIAVGLGEIKRKEIVTLLLIGVFIFGLQAYINECKLEKEEGLNNYLTYIEDEYNSSQVIMADTYFSMTLSIYDPYKEYMIWGNAPECLPFVKYEIFRDWRQLENISTVWLISMDNFRVADLSEYFENTKSISVPYSYYNFVLERYDRK